MPAYCKTNKEHIVQTSPVARFEQSLAGQWGWIAMRGIIAILFSILALAWPLLTLWVLAILWGAFALTDGIFSFVTAWNLHKKGFRWWTYLLTGVVGVAAGLITFFWPIITAIVLVYIIAFWAIFLGVSEIAAAIRLRREIRGEWLLILAGIISILFGLLIFFRPIPQGVLAIAWLVSAYAFITGVLYLALAFKVRKFSKTVLRDE